MKYVDVPAILETVDLFGESDLYQTVIMIYFSVLFNYCFFFLPSSFSAPSFFSSLHVPIRHVTRSWQ